MPRHVIPNGFEELIAERIAAIDQAVARHIANSSDLRRARKEERAVLKALKARAASEKRAALKALKARAALEERAALKARNKARPVSKALYAARRNIKLLREDYVPLEDEGLQLCSIVDSIIESMEGTRDEQCALLSALTAIADVLLPCSGDNFTARERAAFSTRR